MPQETQAWVVEEKNGPFVLKDVVLDDPLEDEVLVEMIASGICHTDLLVASGDLPDGKFPVILGHEGSARVVKTGSKAQRVKPGDLVLLSFGYCTQCDACKEDVPYACEAFPAINFGKQRSSGSPAVGALADGRRVEGSFFGQSSFARHALVKEVSCVVVPADTSSKDMTLLAPLGCGLQTGAGGVFNAANVKSHNTVLINGLGGVGMAALFAALSISPRPKAVLAVDMNEERLNLARELGADAALNPKSLTGSVADEVRRLTGGRGVDYAIEATGHPAAARAAFDALAMRGRLVQIGSSPGELHLPINDILLGLRSVEACCEGNDSPHRLVPRLAKLYKEGKFPVDRIVTTYPWKDMTRALEDMHSGKVIKPVLVFKE